MARRQVSIFINGREVANNIKSITAEKRKINRELNLMTVGSKEYNDKMKELDKLNPVLNKHRNDIRGVDSAWSKISKGATKFIGIAGLAFGAQAVVDYGRELFSLGTEMEVLTKKAATVFGQALPQVTAAAEKNANAMGLTVSQYTDAATAIGDLLIPMKFTREEAASISTNLVDLSGALSEWTGGQMSAEEVTKTLGKAMLGEREELKQLGISIQEADVKARLAEKGLSNLTGEMLQQAKAAATLELITEKSADAQAAFADNSDTLVRKQAEISAKFTEIKESLAEALIPVFHRLVEAAVPVVDVLSRIVQSMFGVGESIVKGVIDAVDWVRVKFAEFQNSVGGVVNNIQEFFGVDWVKIEPINISEFKKSIQDAKKEMDDNRPTEPFTMPKQNLAVNRSAGGQSDKEAKALEKRLQKLQEITDQFNEQRRLKALSEEDRQLTELAAKYDKQIELAKELEAKGVKSATEQRKELERLKAIELQELEDQLFQERLMKAAEQDMQMAEEERLRLEELRLQKAEAQAIIDAEVQETVLNERQQALFDLETHYVELLELARQFGIDTTNLEEAFAKKKSKILQDYNEKDRKSQLEAQKQQAEALVKGFEGAATAIQGVMAVVKAVGAEGTAFGKLLAIAEIGIQSAKAIAAATASAAGVPFPGNIPAIATAVGTVLGNIAQARNIIKDVKVPQKFMGGYANVIGAQDGIRYRAKYIGSPQSGMLPNSPVLLASERGPEYFVSNPDLQNPVIANYVRAIDNISNKRVNQFVDGGLTEGDIQGTGQVGSNNEINRALLVSMDRLNSILESGLFAVVDDDTTVDIFKKFKQLNNASGGVLI